MTFVRSGRFSRIFDSGIESIAATLGWARFRVEQTVIFVFLGICVNIIYGALFLAIVGFSPDWRVGGSMIAYATACAFQYVANAKITFRRKVWDGGQAARFGFAVLLGFAVSTIFLGWIVPAFRLPDILGLLIVAFMLPVLNFITFARLVYRS